MVAGHRWDCLTWDNDRYYFLVMLQLFQMTIRLECMWYSPSITSSCCCLYFVSLCSVGRVSKTGTVRFSHSIARISTLLAIQNSFPHSRLLYFIPWYLVVVSMQTRLLQLVPPSLSPKKSSGCARISSPSIFETTICVPESTRAR